MVTNFEIPEIFESFESEKEDSVVSKPFLTPVDENKGNLMRIKNGTHKNSMQASCAIFFRILESTFCCILNTKYCTLKMKTKYEN